MWRFGPASTNLSCVRAVHGIVKLRIWSVRANHCAWFRGNHSLPTRATLSTQYVVQHKHLHVSLPFEYEYGEQNRNSVKLRLVPINHLILMESSACRLLGRPLRRSAPSFGRCCQRASVRGCGCSVGEDHRRLCGRMPARSPRPISVECMSWRCRKCSAE